MERELLLEIGCEELPAQLAGAADRPARPTRLKARLVELAPRRRRARSRRTPRRGGWPSWRRASPSARPTSTRRSAARRSRRPSPPTAARRRPRSASPASTASRSSELDADRDAEGHLPRRTSRSSGARRRSTCCRTCSAGVLRDLTFPKQMHWDALARRRARRAARSAGRSAGCCSCTAGASCRSRSGARALRELAARAGRAHRAPITYGHRFLAVSGRPGRAVKVRSFTDYKARLAEHFVMLERSERQTRIARELDVHARRLGGRVNRRPSASRACSRKWPISSSTRRSSPARSRRSSSRCPRKC